MLQIQVLGKGLIPRGLGIAPRKEFFKADLTLIVTILNTPGLKVNMLDTETNKIIPVTTANVRRLWDKYRSDRVKTTTTETVVPKSEATATTPTTTATPVVQTTEAAKPETTEVKPVEETKTEEVEVKDETVKTEETKEEKKEATGIKPVNAPENKNNNHNNNHNNHNNNHKK